MAKDKEKAKPAKGSKQEAEQEAANAKSKAACEELMLEQCYLLAEGKVHNVQMILALANRAKKY